VSHDVYIPALLRESQLLVAVAITTEVCRRAQAAHQLAATSTIALGRLATATALAGLSQRKPGITSVQVVCEGRLRQIFAEVTDQGHLRGFIKTKDLSLPQMTEGGPRRRRSVALGVGDGLLAVTREPPDAHFTQSTTKLVSGEVDEDVEHFLNVSDQIPTVLTCDVVLDRDDNMIQSAGLMVQAMPESDGERLGEIKRWSDDGGFIELLREGAHEAEDLLGAAIPDAEPIEGTLPLEWRCRCSYDRVLGALQLFDVSELEDMVNEQQPAIVDCDFCGKRYEVEPDEIARIAASAAHAQG